MCQKYEVSLAFDFQYLNVLRITNELMSLLISITKIINQYKVLYILMDMFLFLHKSGINDTQKQTNKQKTPNRQKKNPGTIGVIEHC